MHHCYVEPGSWSDTTAILSAEESHHLLHVLRARDGESLSLFDGQGRCATGILQTPEPEPGTRPSRKSRDREPARAFVQINQTNHAPSPRWHITILQSLIKPNRMDWMIEKLTELGVARVVPVRAHNCVARIDPDQAEERRARWQRIAIGAARQCHSPWVPRIEPVANLLDAARSATTSCALTLVGALDPQTPHLHHALAPVRNQSAIHIAVLLGPEGDLTPTELAALSEIGVKPVSFGTLIFRAETAALFAAAALRYETDSDSTSSTAAPAAPSTSASTGA